MKKEHGVAIVAPRTRVSFLVHACFFSLTHPLLYSHTLFPAVPLARLLPPSRPILCAHLPRRSLLCVSFLSHVLCAHSLYPPPPRLSCASPSFARAGARSLSPPNLLRVSLMQILCAHLPDPLFISAPAVYFVSGRGGSGLWRCCARMVLPPVARNAEPNVLSLRVRHEQQLPAGDQPQLGCQPRAPAVLSLCGPRRCNGVCVQRG